jgi:tetratricopeptide (TPR) repeat protein
MMRLVLAVFLLALAPGTAKAAWQEASSAHFVVYADDSERSLRTFSEHLERYHSALETITHSKLPVPSPSNRVTVFVVRDQGEVQRLYGKNSRNIGAFYIPRAGASVAIVPQVSNVGASQGELDFSMIALLHEYAHHFMISSNAFAMPRWLSEGGAEFFASADFGKDGSVGLGRPALHRAGELFYARDVNAAQLLDPESYEKHNAGKGFDAFYGKSWLLYHYLVFGGRRDGQLGRYIGELVAGKSSREAGLSAFGPFDKLENELDAYLMKSRIAMVRLPATMLHAGEVRIRRLSEGEAAMMPIRIRSRRGVTREEAGSLVVKARDVAGRFPQDAAVLAALAEAEYDAGNSAEAIAAADRALALDPAQVNAYVQKGFALFRQAAEGGGPAGFAKARAPFIALNRLENDHPLALAYYYFSYLRAGTKPPQLAVDGLEMAVQLAPFDMGLRMTLAMQELRDRHPDWARRNLAPVAYNPHGGSLAETAQRVLTRLDAEPAWTGEGFQVPADEGAD